MRRTAARGAKVVPLTRTPPDPASPQPPAHSDPARPERRIRLRQQQFSAVAAELMPLMQRHHAELSDPLFPLNIDTQRVLMLEHGGSLKLLTVRDGNKLIGYVMAQGGPHIFYMPFIHATITNYWLDPDYRNGWLGYRMFKAMLRLLAQAGAVRVFGSVSAKYMQGRTGSIFKRLGFQPHEMVWSKVTELPNG